MWLIYYQVTYLGVFLAKITVKLDGLKQDLKKFQRATGKALARELPNIIRKEIEGGRSPVKGFGRFERYSQSYSDAIKAGRYDGKRTRPVNLKLTGEMLSKIKGVPLSNGMRLKFDDPLWDIHNDKGAGKSKTVRRLIPTNEGEEFNLSIQRDVREILNRIARNIFR